LEDSANKKSLRNRLLEQRDNTSHDLLEMSSEKIQKKLRKIFAFKNAQKIGIYYPIGSEVFTQDIIQELLSQSKDVFLPKVVEKNIEFRKIKDFSNLERGSFDILEPKDGCPVDNNLDVILVPTVGISQTGVRLGYGHGFYDRFLSEHKTVAISLVLEKQIIKNIPKLPHDVIMNWIVTEERATKISEKS